MHTLEEKRGTDPRGCLVEGKGTMGRGGGRRNRRQSPRSPKSQGASGALPSPGGSHPPSKSVPRGGGAGPTSSLTSGSEPHQTHKRTGRAEDTAVPWGPRGEADLLVTQSREWRSHILAGAHATAGASRAQLPSWAPGLGGQEAGTEAHPQARTTDRRAAWLPQQRRVGSWEPRDTCQPCPTSTTFVELGAEVWPGDRAG